MGSSGDLLAAYGKYNAYAGAFMVCASGIAGIAFFIWKIRQPNKWTNSTTATVASLSGCSDKSCTVTANVAIGTKIYASVLETNKPPPSVGSTIPVLYDNSVPPVFDSGVNELTKTQMYGIIAGIVCLMLMMLAQAAIAGSSRTGAQLIGASSAIGAIFGGR
jgi:hypothetical protein